jgi:catechol 2,3-dioxygenase-like lactoylglutathione lyase family enzyme
MNGAPLPLLGTFHEVSIASSDVRAAVEFYERLGFRQASTNDILTHPYGVLSDGRLCIGLHQRPGPSPVLSFVRPGIAASLGEFERAGIELGTVHVGEEVFNEVAFTDPFGTHVAVLEARTYSPLPDEHSGISQCGDFAEVSVPVNDFAAAQAFWEPLGFVAAEETQVPYPHLVLTSDHLDLAFHRSSLCDRPMLVFHAADMRARIAHLKSSGLPLTAVPGAARDSAAFLTDSERTPLLLLEAEP